MKPSEFVNLAFKLSIVIAILVLAAMGFSSIEEHMSSCSKVAIGCNHTSFEKLQMTCLFGVSLMVLSAAIVCGLSAAVTFFKWVLDRADEDWEKANKSEK